MRDATIVATTARPRFQPNGAGDEGRIVVSIKVKDSESSSSLVVDDELRIGAYGRLLRVVDWPMSESLQWSAPKLEQNEH